MGNVVPIRKPEISDASDSTGEYEKVPIQVYTTDNRSTGRTIDTKELYPLSHEFRPELAKAFSLLSEGLEYITDAINGQREGDLISSDDSVQRLQALLPELFCCRSIGDGFGAIINAIYHSIANMQGVALNAAQLEAIKRGLRRISTEPFLEFSEAVDEIIPLQDVGFELEPPYFKYAADLLDE